MSSVSHIFFHKHHHMLGSLIFFLLMHICSNFLGGNNLKNTFLISTRISRNSRELWEGWWPQSSPLHTKKVLDYVISSLGFFKLLCKTIIKYLHFFYWLPILNQSYLSWCRLLLSQNNSSFRYSSLKYSHSLDANLLCLKQNCGLVNWVYIRIK